MTKARACSKSFILAIKRRFSALRGIHTSRHAALRCFKINVFWLKLKDFEQTPTILIRWLIGGLLLAGLLTGCSSMNHSEEGGTSNLAELKKLRGEDVIPTVKGGVNPIRAKALKETALSIGAQSGLAWRSTQIDAFLSTDDRNLNATYNFYAMLLPHDVLPPVLTQASNTLHLASPDSLRLANQTYTILQQARFVTAPPTWREYLWMNFPQPPTPNKTLLPKDAAEQRIWNEYVTKGWYEGIDQANAIFNENLARLQRNYQGMILYRKLLAEKMVSQPFVAQTNLGVTGNGSSISINDRVLLITALPELQTNPQKWQAIISPTTENDGD